MPFKKTAWCSERATHTAVPRKLFKRMRLRTGSRIYYSVWLCRGGCYCTVAITHVAPKQRNKQPAAMRAVKASPMRCPQCAHRLTFLGFQPASEFLEPWEPRESEN